MIVGITNWGIEVSREVQESSVKYIVQNEPSAGVLRIAIEEQRREYDLLNDAKHRVAAKTLTLAGAGLALLTFLYSSGKLFIPNEMYGKVFYAVGALLTLGAVSVLLYATKPAGRWELPPEVGHLENLNEKDERRYLEYVKDRYLACYQLNAKHYQTKQRLMNMSFYPLVFGAIILIVIRIFGGQV